MDPSAFVEIVEACQEVIKATNQVRERENVNHDLEELEQFDISSDFWIHDAVTRVDKQPLRRSIGTSCWCIVVCARVYLIVYAQASKQSQWTEHMQSVLHVCVIING